MRSIWGVPWRSFSRLVPKSRPPTWWQQGWARHRAGSVAEAELLAPLGELLMPGMPLEEMFRSFKSPAGWGGHYLEPDLTTYGVLKNKTAALFVEYDGYYRHAEREGIVRDQMKNAALLAFAPSGSYVVRINHQDMCQQEENVLWVGVDTWRRGDHTSLGRTLRHVFREIVPKLQHALHPVVYKYIETHVWNEGPLAVSKSAREFCEAAVVFVDRGNTAEEVSSFLKSEGFLPAEIDQMQKRGLVGGRCIDKTLQPLIDLLLDLGMTKSQIARAVATYPKILSLSIQQKLTPTVQWFLDLGLTKSQVAKAVSTHPQILAYSIKQNLTPTVQWFLDLGLTKSQVAKGVATYPRILGYSIRQNLTPTVQWLLDLGLTKSQITRAVGAFPKILGYSIEQNLKPTAQWFSDLGLKRSQIAKMVSTFPAIVGLSTDNLALKMKHLQSFLAPACTVELIARWPVILGYSHQRLEKRLNVLAEQESLAKLIGAMSLTEDKFNQRFLVGSEMCLWRV